MSAGPSRPVALIFPGQGSQRPGMARDFHDRFPEARAAFEEASGAVGVDLAALCFAGDARLELTEFAQPAILTAEIAMVRALTAHYGLRARWFAGHSLGEYTALVAAGVCDLGAAARLVRERGRLMQEAVPAGRGGMRALVHPNLDAGVIERALSGLQVDVANLNAPDQVVLSGLSTDLDTAFERIRAIPELGRARAIPLKVSTPFHSRFMRGAGQAFAPLLAAASAAWRCQPAGRVASNRSGGFHEPVRERIVEALVEQVSSPVRWLDNMRALLACRTRIVEIGPSRPLRALFARLDTDVEAVTDLATAEKWGQV